MNDVVGGRYEVRRLLGAGGMASVYLAHDPLLRRDVAIKVPRLSGNGADAETLDRFQDELRSIARLNHPNIVTIYDGGQDDGTPYLVMEPVEGESLAQLIRREAPLPVDRAVEIACQMAEALAYAHSLGVVHRDVKPQNVLLDTTGRVKVTDFGIAKSSDITRTLAGTILGTPNFIAPEVAAGEPVTRAADVYALGVVLYQMLTGHTPFESENPIAAAVRSQREDAAPPSTLAAVPSWLDGVVLKALAREPAQRYGSAAELAQDLHARRAPARPAAGPRSDEHTTQRIVLTSKTKGAPAPPPASRKRRPAILMLPLIIVVIVAVGVALAARQAPSQIVATGSPGAPSASASVAPQPSGAANLVTNGALSSNGEQPNGWRLQVFGGRQPIRVWRPGGPSNGDREITLQSQSATDSAWIGNDVNAKPGMKLTLSGYIKTTNVGGDGPGASVAVVCHDGAAKITGQGASQGVHGSANWRQEQAQLTVPNGTTACQPQLRLGGDGKMNSGEAEFSRIVMTGQ